MAALDCCAELPCKASHGAAGEGQGSRARRKESHLEHDRGDGSARGALGKSEKAPEVQAQGVPVRLPRGRRFDRQVRDVLGARRHAGDDVRQAGHDVVLNIEGRGGRGPGALGAGEAEGGSSGGEEPLDELREAVREELTAGHGHVGDEG